MVEYRCTWWEDTGRNAPFDDDGIARRYNGPSYAKNGYDKNLAARFAWWHRKPDTSWSSPTAANLDAAAKTSICPTCGKALAA